MEKLLTIVLLGLLVASVLCQNDSSTETTPGVDELLNPSKLIRQPRVRRATKQRSDYVYYGSNGYKLHVKPKNWTDARYACSDEDSYLAVIYNISEYWILQDLYRKGPAIKTDFRNIYAFVGIHDLYEEGKWVTIFDQSIDEEAYYKWDIIENRQQPDNGIGTGEEHDCGALVKNGYLADVSCARAFPFFCKHHLA